MDAFDIDRFMDGSGRVALDAVDWDEVPHHRLTPEALRTLRFFLVTESSTFYYVKALMRTRAAVDEPVLAPFLSAWLYEEEFHGRAFRRFLEAYGERVPDHHRRRIYLGRNLGERRDEIAEALLSVLLPEEWPAIHMVWGAIQELTTYTAYRRLGERAAHPQLSVLCERIMKQELKHFAFYREQADRRLRASRRAQRVATAALKLGWRPVGAGMSPAAEVDHAIRFLFDGAEGDAVAGIERRIRALPGLEWFDLFSRFVARRGLRRAPAQWFARGGRERASPAAAHADPAAEL
jgi:rubrerythrin